MKIPSFRTQVKTAFIVALTIGASQSMELQEPFKYQEPYENVNRNDPVALYNLGMNFLNGDSVEINFFTALQYLSLSARLGYCHAQYTLGYIHYNKHNYPAAYKYFKSACYKFGTDEETQAFDDAMIMIGIMHDAGKGVPQDLNMASDCFYLVAKKNHQGALLNLTLLADEGNAAGQLNLAQIYHNGHSYIFVDGEPVRQGIDFDKALKYSALSADQGNADAQLFLSSMYFLGQGVDQDALMGISLLHKSMRTDLKGEDTLKSFFTFISSEYDISSQNISSEVVPFEIDGDLYIQLQMSDLFSSFGGMKLIPNDSHLKELDSPYQIVLNFFGDSDCCLNILENNLNTSGFGISCLKPTVALLKEYKEHSQGEKTGCCFLNMDNKDYFFIEDKSPGYGYELKQLLGVKKDEVVAVIATLESTLFEKISELKDLGNSISNSDQIAQLTNELKLVGQAKNCVHKYIASIQEMLRSNLQDRNRVFIEENPFYRDM